MSPRIYTVEDYLRLSESERTARTRALQAVAIARREGSDLTSAASQAGSSMDDIRMWAEDAVRSWSGRGHVAREDSIARLRPLFVEGGLEFLVVNGSMEAKRVERILDDQYRFIEGNATRGDVKQHADITIAGRQVEADPDVLIAIGLAGDADVPESYRALFS